MALVKWIDAINDTRSTLEGFVKNCADSSECNKTNECSRFREKPSVERIIKCEIRCCQGDLCNRYEESQNGGKNWTK